MKTVIFACVHNAGRSQMAAAFFNKLADRATARRDDWPLKTQWVNPLNAFGLFATTFALAWRR